MIIIVTEIKKKFYQILTEELGYTVYDNRESIEEDTSFPLFLLRFSTGRRDRIKGVTVNSLRFSIDIFSEYDGEAEILDIEDKIFNAMQGLYDIKDVVYVQENSFRIVDDKSTGVMMKHGILNYLVLSSGIEELIEEEESDEETDNPS